MHNFMFINEDDFREYTALILTLATIFFNSNNNKEDNNVQESTAQQR